MNFDPTNIALIALGISVISLLISLYNSNIDRRVQLAQLKGEMETSLFHRITEMLSHIKELQKELEVEPTKDKIEILQAITNVSQKTVEAHRIIKKKSVFSPFSYSILLPTLQDLKNDVDSIEILFDQLNEVILNRDLDEIRVFTDSLINRLS